jgi:hypothetical protein
MLKKLDILDVVKDYVFSFTKFYFLKIFLGVKVQHFYIEII